MWNLPPPPGFHGLDPNKPLKMYERHLPHWRQEGATYFVTFRLADWLPQVKLQELILLRRQWEQQNPPPRSNEALESLAKQLMDRVERWLDQGMGSCVLKDRKLVALVMEAMHHFDGSRYELDAYVVMPNHVHAILRPLQAFELESLVGSWKQYSSRRINTVTGKTGELWQEESFDRIIRDEEHLYRVLQYVGNNPVRAGLTLSSCLRWVRPQWHDLGWRFE